MRIAIVYAVFCIIFSMSLFASGYFQIGEYFALGLGAFIGALQIEIMHHVDVNSLTNKIARLERLNAILLTAIVCDDDDESEAGT